MIPGARPGWMLGGDTLMSEPDVAQEDHQQIEEEVFKLEFDVNEEIDEEFHTDNSPK